MKKLKTFLSILILLFSAVLFAQNFWGGKTMSASQVKTKWGNEKFELKKFKDGSYQIKAKMAYSIMIDNSLIGKSYEYIEENLGTHDGFYFVDTYPAYIIQEGKNHSEETWQLVFKMDSQYKVRDVIMHKNCCDK